jgi:hypothetical protein
MEHLKKRPLTQWMQGKSGCLQEGVLSPLLWNMVLDGLLRSLRICILLGYADDVILLQKGKFVSTLCDHMQGALNCICQDNNGPVHE